MPAFARKAFPDESLDIISHHYLMGRGGKLPDVGVGIAIGSLLIDPDPDSGIDPEVFAFRIYFRSR